VNNSALTLSHTVLREDGRTGAARFNNMSAIDVEYHYFNFTNEDKALLKPVMFV